jgi:hypothetical protein
MAIPVLSRHSRIGFVQVNAKNAGGRKLADQRGVQPFRNPLEPFKAEQPLATKPAVRKQNNR